MYLLFCSSIQNFVCGVGVFFVLVNQLPCRELFYYQYLIISFYVRKLTNCILLFMIYCLSLQLIIVCHDIKNAIIKF